MSRSIGVWKHTRWRICLKNINRITVLGRLRILPLYTPMCIIRATLIICKRLDSTHCGKPSKPTGAKHQFIYFYTPSTMRIRNLFHGHQISLIFTHFKREQASYTVVYWEINIGLTAAVHDDRYNKVLCNRSYIHGCIILIHYRFSTFSVSRLQNRYKISLATSRPPLSPYLY